MKKLLFLFLLLPPIILTAQSTTELVVQTGNTRINDIVFTPDGKQLFVAGEQLKLWDVATGREIMTYKGELAGSNVLAHTSDCKYVASVSQRDTIYIWDTGSREILSKLTGHTDIYTLAFSKDGKYLVSGSWDNTIILWDIKKKKKIRRYTDSDDDIFALTFSPDGENIVCGNRNGYIYIWNLDGKLIEKHKASYGYIYDIIITPASDMLLFCTSGNSIEACAYPDIKKKLYEIKLGNFYGVDLSLAPSTKTFAISSNKGIIGTYETSTGKKLTELKIENQTSDEDLNYITSVAFSPDGKFILGSRMFDVIMWEIKSHKQVKLFKGYSTSINQTIFHADNKHIISCQSDGLLNLWNLASGKLVNSFDGHVGAVRDFDCSSNGKYLVSGGADSTIRYWDYETGEQLSVIKAHDHSVMDVAFAGDEKVVSAGGYDNKLKLWNIHTKENIWVQEPFENGILKLAVSPDCKQVVCGSGLGFSLTKDINSSSALKFYSIASGKIIDSIPDAATFANSLVYSPDGKKLACTAWNGFSLWDVETKKNITPVDSLFEFEVAFSNNSQTILAAWKDIKQIDIKSKQIIRTIYDPTIQINSICFSGDEKFIMTSCKEGTIKLRDNTSGKTLCTMVPLANSADYVIYTPDGYYMSTKNGTSAVHFIKNKKIFLFDQFDIQFNRPDKVIERIGLASNELIRLYKKAYQKRLTKTGFTEDAFSPDRHIPTITVRNKHLLPYITKNNKMPLHIEAFDNKYNLACINIRVNGVPVSGMRGIDVREQKTQSISENYTVTLSQGENIIKITAQNVTGAESYSENLFVMNNQPGKKPDLYIVAIGVSEYTEKNFNLQYAAKDAVDLVNTLKKQTTRYNTIHKTVLLNQMATKENILKVKEKLMQTGVDDVVVLFMAGHGLLNENLDYYLATYDIDFQHPSLRGLAYDELESLLDNIPARKKLMLIDACHSGELDKEAELMPAYQDVKLVNVSFRSIQGSRGFKKKSNISYQNTFELMKELFNDLRRGTGAMVISSAGGGEFAYEGGNWNNGIFTYTVIEGLTTGKADRNENQEITVSELRNYVFDKVSELTNGLQNPTSRKENPEFDFRIW